METWRKVWRNGFAPVLSTAHLEAIRDGLERDDAGLIQDATTSPSITIGDGKWPVEAACVIGYGGWKGEGLTTVDDVEAFFGRTCCEADQRIREYAACRYFLNWFDVTPREEMRRELLAEVSRALGERRDGGAESVS